MIIVGITDSSTPTHGASRLSPAFDINSESDGAYLSTTIDGASSDRNVELALSVADYFRLDSDDSSTNLEEVVTTVSGWKSVAQRNGLSDEEIGCMRNAFDALSQVG
jgi:serine/threonine-protein kinase HipA